MGLQLGLGFSALRASGGGPAPADTVAGLRDGSTPNGRTSAATLMVAGVDPLPSGMAIVGHTITISTPQAVIEDWDFKGYTLDIKSEVGMLTQCLFGDGSVEDLTYFITGNSSGKVWELSYCTFTGRGDSYGASTAINCAPSGSGVSVTALDIVYGHHLRFLALRSDGIKAAGSPHWNGQRWEWIYFAPPQNLPNTPTVWDAVTTYADNYCVTDPGTGWYYRSKAGSNLNNALPPGVTKTEENTWWQGLDPHADAITVPLSINRTAFRYCLADWTNDPPGPDGPYGNQGGVTNAWRISRNTGTDYLLDGVLLEGCESTWGTSLSSPVQVVDNGLDNFNGPIIFRDMTIAPNSSAIYFHPSTNGTVDYWINTSGAAPTGATTTDAAAVPSFTSSPTLTGDAEEGATLTADVGAASGFPAPFFDLVIQRSDDGSTGWTDVLVGRPTLVLSAGDVGKYFRTSVRSWNSSGEDFDVSSVVGPVVAGYTMAEVDTNAAGRLTINPGGSANCLSISFWVTFNSMTSPTTTPRFIRASSGFDFYVNSSGTITAQVWNSAGTGIFTGSSAPGQISPGSRYHVFFSYNGVTGTPILRVNGNAVTLTPSVGPNTGAVRPNRGHEILHITTNVSDALVGDYWLEYGAAVRDYTTFWNGGTPPDLTGIGAPQLWLGGAMRADQDEGGNTSHGWNDGYNLGSGTVTVVATGFADVP